MKKLIIVTGPMGVGKTVVGTALADTMGRTAFIDGDWCLDIHPFIGNKETKDMAMSNIVFMIKNYCRCSESDSIVLSWVMSENTIQKIISNVNDIELMTYIVTLVCSKESLVARWSKDMTVKWRTNELLASSIKSIENYEKRRDTILIDTSDIGVKLVVDEIKVKLASKDYLY